MKRKITIVLMSMVCLAAILWAGDLNPSAPPTAGTMKSLDDVEPRIAIHQSDIPLTISTSGSYYLAENITYSAVDSSSCITISADHVTIDLCGFTLSGSGGFLSHGISMSGRDNVEIRNGTICNFGYGILDGSAGQNHRVLGVRMMSCLSHGILLQLCKNCQVRDCTVTDGCTMTGGSTYTYAIFVGDNSIVSGNTVYNNGTSSTYNVVGIYTTKGCTVTGNTIYGNGASATGDAVYGVMTSSRCTITGNTVHDNGDLVGDAIVYGIDCDSACVVTGNTSCGNGDNAGYYVYGIYTNTGCTVDGNTSFDNGDAADGNVYGICVGGGGMINNNSVYSNGTSATGSSVYGIYAYSGGVVTGNIARSNGISASGTIYGICLGGYNLVNNNAAYNNTGTGGGTNMNTVASCVYGTNCAP